MPRKKSSPFFNFTILVLVFVGSLLAYLFWGKVKYLFNDYDRENNFVLYPGFGIYLPTNYAIHGIDVSRYQKRINWPMVKQMKDGNVQIGFVFIKATEGTNLTDEQFARNWKKSRENNLVRGAYHYFIASRSGVAQARNFMAKVDLQPGDLPPVIDVESLNGTDANTLQNNVAEFLTVVEEHYGVKPIIYSNATFYNNYLQNRFSDYPLWVAHYFERRQPRVSASWQFWQHNEAGHVNGIVSRVDFNVFSGDSMALKQLLLK